MSDLVLQGIQLEGRDGGPLFHNLDLAMQSGESMLINGCTEFARGQLLKMAAGLLQPRAGTCSINGRQLWPGEGLAAWPKRPRMGLCFGRGGLLSNMTLRDNLELPALFSTGIPTSDIRAASQDLLSRFDLLPLAGLRPFALDARTRKLANLLRIRLLDPEFIFLDDPLAELGEADHPEIGAWIRSWAEDPHRILMVSACEDDPDIQGLSRKAMLRHGQLGSVEECA